MPTNLTLENNPNSTWDNLLDTKKPGNNLESPAGPQRISVGRWMGPALCGLPCPSPRARGTSVLPGAGGVRFVLF